MRSDRGEEDDAVRIHHERSFKHEVSEAFGIAEVSVGGCGPALAERSVVDESGMESTEVRGEGSVMNAKGGCGGIRYLRVENGPLVLQGAAVGGARGE